MTAREQYIRALEDNFLSTIETVKVKSSDYATEEDPFWNFRFSAQCQETTVQRAILGRIGEKLGRFINLLGKEERGQGPAVEDETMNDTLRDLMATVNILCVYREWQTKPVDGYLYSGAEEDYAFEPEEIEYRQEEPDDPNAPQNTAAPSLEEIEESAPPAVATKPDTRQVLRDFFLKKS